MIFGLPLPLIGSAFGAIMGWFTKRQAMQSEIVAAERAHQLEAMVAVTQANSQAVDDEIRLLEARHKYVNPETCRHQSITRRYVSYTLLISFCFLVPAVVLFGDLQWFHVHEWTTSGFFGLGRRSMVEVITAVGLPLIWLEGLLTFVSTVVSFYLGNSAAKYNNPYTKR